MIVKLILLVVIISLISTGMSYLGPIKAKNKAKKKTFKKRGHKRN